MLILKKNEELIINEEIDKMIEYFFGLLKLYLELESYEHNNYSKNIFKQIFKKIDFGNLHKSYVVLYDKTISFKNEIIDKLNNHNNDKKSVVLKGTLHSFIDLLEISINLSERLKEKSQGGNFTREEFNKLAQEKELCKKQCELNLNELTIIFNTIKNDGYLKVRIFGVGKLGKDIIDKLAIDIKLVDYLYINDSEIITIDKQSEIADFISDSDVVIIAGSVTNEYNVIHFLHCIKSNIDKIILPIVILENKTDNQYHKLLKNIMPNTILIEGFDANKINKAITNILISTCFPSEISRYGALIHTDAFDLKYILSDGNTHNIEFGFGIGVNRAKDSVLMAINNLSNNINILEVKMLLFLFNLPTNATLNEVEDAIEMFRKEHNYANDISFMCVLDEKMPIDELELTVITTKE